MSAADRPRGHRRLAGAASIGFALALGRAAASPAMAGDTVDLVAIG